MSWWNSCWTRSVQPQQYPYCRGTSLPAEVVKSRFLKLEAQHIQYVLDSLKDNQPHIRNIKKYLLAALYNAPLTIENYYAAQINHDLYGRNRGDVNWK